MGIASTKRAMSQKKKGTKRATAASFKADAMGPTT
jgi:hypothetical protein